MDRDCWCVSDGQLVVDLTRSPELGEVGGAIRLEGRGLPERILVIRGEDDTYHAFCNRCSHGGRRLDPVPGEAIIQCCSMGKSTFDYEGQIIQGPAPDPAKPLQLTLVNRKLVIKIA